MFSRTLIAAAAAFSVSAGQAFAASPFSTIYSFGDSLSDAGNLYLAKSGAEPGPPYYAYNVGPIQLGEFSNGPVWVQDLAAQLGLLTPLPSLLGGADYAWGGATAGTSVTSVPNLVNQTQQFLGDHGSAPSNALYTFSAGANDLFGILDGTAPPSDLPADAQAVATAAGDLQSAGAKDLVLFDVPDLGKAPGVLALGQTASEAASALSYSFDQLVLADLAPVEKLGLDVFDLNTYALIDEAVADPAKFGFTDVTTACYPGPYTGGGSACPNPDQYLFWDSVHPTAAGHAIAANVAYGLVPTPEPSTWAMLILGFIGLGAVGAQRTRAAAKAL